MKVEVLPLYGDNYIYLIVEGDLAVVVDPSAAEPVISGIKASKLKLSQAIVTHHHGDHTGGCLKLKASEGCEVVGPASSIPGVDITVGDGEKLDVLGSDFDVIGLPGHTKDHVAYYSSDAGIIFVGDVLFAGGCGRLFEGTAEEMWSSMLKLRDLPDETLVYFGHEYTKDNLEFAVHLEPSNLELKRRLSDVTVMIAAGKSTTPSNIGLEKATNPFLRADTVELATAVKLPNSSPSEVFAAIRKIKNSW